MPTVKMSWQWAAAVYQTFTTNYSAVGIKPTDDSTTSIYKNSDHAGTPENFKQFVVGGARGGGGSNFTGSNSATVTVSPCPPTTTTTTSTNTSTASALSVSTQQTSTTSTSTAAQTSLASPDSTQLVESSIFGTVLSSKTGAPVLVTLVLTGTDVDGNVVGRVTMTDAQGNYSFDNLNVGTYVITLFAGDGMTTAYKQLGTVSIDQTQASTTASSNATVTQSFGGDTITVNSVIDLIDDPDTALLDDSSTSAL